MKAGDDVVGVAQTNITKEDGGRKRERERRVTPSPLHGDARKMRQSVFFPRDVGFVFCYSEPCVPQRGVSEVSLSISGSLGCLNFNFAPE